MQNTHDLIQEAYAKAEAAAAAIAELNKERARAQEEYDTQARQGNPKEPAHLTMEERVFARSLLYDHKLSQVNASIELEKERLATARAVLQALTVETLMRDLLAKQEPSAA